MQGTKKGAIDREIDDARGKYADDPEEFAKELAHIFRFHNNQMLLEYLNKHITPNQPDLAVVINKMISNMEGITFAIDDVVDRVTRSLPDNPHNILGVLYYLSDLDLFNDQQAINRLAMAKSELNSDTGEYIYSLADIASAAEKSYEEGYQRGLEAARKTKPRGRPNIDLD